MSDNEMLMGAVARFVDKDVETFRREWNSAVTRTINERNTAQEVEQIQKSTEQGGFSVRVLMKYSSVSGEIIERQVVLRRTFKNKNDVFVDALCLDINKPCLVNLKNIIQIIDIKTKTLYSKPISFFENVLGLNLPDSTDNQKSEQLVQKTIQQPAPSGQSSLIKGELKTAIDLTRYEVTALLFISGIDGDRDPRELKTIVDYVHARCPNLSFNDDDLMNYLQMFYPDNQSFFFALERILGLESWIVKMFVEKLIALITADRRIDEKERLFLSDFMRVLKEEGFELHFNKPEN